MKFGGLRSGVNAVRFFPSGDLVAAAANDGIVRAGGRGWLVEDGWEGLAGGGWVGGAGWWRRGGRGWLVEGAGW